MEIEVLQENLVKALSNVGRVTSSKTGLPILANILLRTDGKQLLIAGTNLEIASTQYIGAKITTPGSITIPAKIITDYIQNLPKDKITLKVKNNSLHISCGSYKSTINGTSDEEFPELPGIDEVNSVRYTLSTLDFKNTVQQTMITASSDSTRPILTGVYWHVSDKNLILAATDSYRLAEKELMTVSTDIAAIVPVSTLQEVLRSLPDDTDEIEILFDEIQVRFRFADSEITSKLIDGNFPDYRQLIPQTSETNIEVAKADFARIVKIAALFAKDSGGAITLTVDEETKRLTVNSIASEVGENSSVLDLKTCTGSGSVTLNARYILEMLGAMSTNDISVGFSNSIAPCVFRPISNESYTHIIMPIKS